MDQTANGADHIFAIKVGSDLVIFADSNHDGSITAADDAVILAGRSLADVAGGNFI
jgi:hypothetical protein